MSFLSSMKSMKTLKILISQNLDLMQIMNSGIFVKLHDHFLVIMIFFYPIKSVRIAMILISSDVFISTRTNLPWFSFFRASSSLFAILAFSTSSVLAERKKDVKVTVDAMQQVFYPFYL